MADLILSRVPLLNVRSEFNRTRHILNSPELRAELIDWRFGVPIHADFVIWGGEPSTLLSWFVQRIIIGAEAYIPPAAFLAGIHYDRLSERLRKATGDPFSLRCGSAAQTYYNCLPGLVQCDFQMRLSRPSTWETLQRFYKETRNPLFHGSQLHTEGHKYEETLDSVLKVVDLFTDVYNWLDWWIPANLLSMTGSIPTKEPPKLSTP